MRNVIAGEKLDCRIENVYSLKGFMASLSEAVNTRKSHVFYDEVPAELVNSIKLEAVMYPDIDIFLSVESLNRFTITGPQAAIRKYSKYIP